MPIARDDDKTIWKYKLRLSDGPQAVEMHCRSEIVSVAMQGDDVCFWATVNRSNDVVVRYFGVFGTGHPLPHESYKARYVGTVHEHLGMFVWHVFELYGDLTRTPESS